MPFDQNWDADVQTQQMDVTGYIERARQLRVPTLLKIKDFLLACPNAILKDDGEPIAGYYSIEPKTIKSPDGKQVIRTTSLDSLIEEIQNNDLALQKKGQDLIDKALGKGKTNEKEPKSNASDTVQIDNRFIKDERSAYRKARDYEVNGVPHPEKLGDYLRFQVLFDNTLDLVKARHELQFGNAIQITSQKDRLRYPHKETGHRAFLASGVAEDKDGELKFEMMLSLLQVEAFYGIDKTLRDDGRVCLKMATSHKNLSTAYSNAAGLLQHTCFIALSKVYESIPGMDKLLAHDCELSASLDWANQQGKKLLPKTSGVMTRETMPTAHGLAFRFFGN